MLLISGRTIIKLDRYQANFKTCHHWIFLLWSSCIVQCLVSTLFSFLQETIPSKICCSLSRYIWKLSCNRTCSRKVTEKRSLTNVTIRQLSPGWPWEREIGPFCRGLTKAAPPNNNFICRSDHCGQNEEIFTDIKKRCGRKQWHC